MIIEYIFSIVQKYGWDRLNDEQKFNLSLYATFEYVSDVIWKSNNSSKAEFEKSIAMVDFSSIWSNIYFEYSFWLVVEFLQDMNHWFIVPLLSSSSEIKDRYEKYLSDKAKVKSHIDYGRELKHCEILFRNKKLK